MILVIDVGTTSLRAAVVDGDATIRAIEHRPFSPASPSPGLVEFDATELSALVLDAARAVLDRAGPVTAVGITNQRASTIVWDRATGVPVGPALGWQDLRTVGECLVARAEHDVSVAPNQTATKAAWLLNAAKSRTGSPAGEPPGDDLCVGTVDSWVAWTLSGGELHVTDHSNAAMTGLFDPFADTWSPRLTNIFGVDVSRLPTVVSTSGVVGEATALPGRPPIAALVGDQQGSLVGQGCVHPGMAKITFGTGAMLDLCTGDRAPDVFARSDHGTFPVVAWSRDGRSTWGVEAIMLSAGTNVDWLRDDLGVIADGADSHTVASTCDDTGGVVYVPALLGLGTPHWDYGARGSLFGLSRGTTRAQVVRAVLEGIAHRGADMVDAVERHTGAAIPSVRIDGGMSQNPTFVQALADATGVTVEVSPVVEATTLGAAYLAGLATGVWADVDDIAAAWQPAAVVEPRAARDGAGYDRARARARWADAIGHTTRWIPDLSALDF